MSAYLTLFSRQAWSFLLSLFNSTAYSPPSPLFLPLLNFFFYVLTTSHLHLHSALPISKEPAVKDMARLHLAGVQLDQKQYDAAMKTLAGSHSDAFAFRFEDMRGDVLMAQGKKNDARAAYQAAFNKMEKDNPYRSIVELKLDALGGETK